MSTKLCSQCRIELAASEFAKHRNALQSMCKGCNREYQRGHYQRNRADYISKALVRNDARRAANLTRILEYFAAHPCTDCGLADPLVLHFDHVRGRKLGNIGSMIQGGYTWERIAAEIAKSDVRCAACHFKRHASGDRWLKLRLAEATAEETLPLIPAHQPDLPIDVSPLAAAAKLKWCGACGQDLPLSDFAKRGPGSRSWKCKACQRAYARDHYRMNRAKYLARVRIRHGELLATNMALLVIYLRTHPCVDCGEGNPVVLQFDHVRGVKSGNLAQMVRSGVTWDRILLEVSKCEVRCVNCHFRRHARSRNTRKLRTLANSAGNLGAVGRGAPSSSG